MSKYRSLIDQFSGRGPLLNIVLDGYGIGKQDHTDAVHLAKTPFIDSLKANYAHTTLATHGKHVGLPNEKDLGGSEVGHLTIGAGIIIEQGPSLIKRMIDQGDFFEFPVLNTALEKGKKGALHLLGLLSDGNIHSHIDHFVAVIEAAVKQGVQKCYVHALLDGRDVGIQTAQFYVEQLEKIFHDINSSHEGWTYAFASGGGREVITMDRDNNWEKIENGWKCHVLGESGNNFPNTLTAIEHFRKETPGLVDQDCPPFNLVDKNGQTVKIQDGDAVLFMNFRGDRAIEISRAFTEENFSEFSIDRPDIYYAGMMVYDEDSDLPEHRILDSPKVDDPFGKRILSYGLDQFRLTETQKFAHVTFFFNGGYRNPLDAKKEEYCLIPSDKVASFALAPEMQALKIAERASKLLQEGKFNYGLINFANADMVGHSGNLQAAIQAVETVDLALKKVCEAVKKANGIALITADHGNADEMLITNKKTGKEEICTKHSINPVPLIIFDPHYKQDYQLKTKTDLLVPNLSMIAATNHILMGRETPDDLNESLFLV